jgi:hypothetical protein
MDESWDCSRIRDGIGVSTSTSPAPRPRRRSKKMRPRISCARLRTKRLPPATSRARALAPPGHGIWVPRDQRSFAYHVCPVAGITAAYLRYHHVFVPLLPAVALEPDPGGPEPLAPIDAHGVGPRVCAPMLAYAAWDWTPCDVPGCPALLRPGDLLSLQCALGGRRRLRPDVGICRLCSLLGRLD